MVLRLKIAVQGLQTNPTISVDLVNAITHAIIATASTILPSNGEVDITFSQNPTNALYLTISGGAILKTASATAMVAVNNFINYDFTTAKSKAFRGNQIEKTTGVWALYNGDFNQDGVIDNSDAPLFDDSVMNLIDLESNIINSIYSMLPV